MNPVVKWISAGLLIAAGFWLFRRLSAPAEPSAPSPTDLKWKQADDNAPVDAYAIVVPPIAQNVRPNGSNVILRKNDPYIPTLYSLGAYGPNRNA